MRRARLQRDVAGKPASRVTRVKRRSVTDKEGRGLPRARSSGTVQRACTVVGAGSCHVGAGAKQVRDTVQAVERGRECEYALLNLRHGRDNEPRSPSKGRGDLQRRASSQLQHLLAAVVHQGVPGSGWRLRAVLRAEEQVHAPGVRRAQSLWITLHEPGHGRHVAARARGEQLRRGQRLGRMIGRHAFAHRGDRKGAVGHRRSQPSTHARAAKRARLRAAQSAQEVSYYSLEGLPTHPAARAAAWAGPCAAAPFTPGPNGVPMRWGYDAEINPF